MEAIISLSCLGFVQPRHAKTPKLSGLYELLLSIVYFIINYDVTATMMQRGMLHFALGQEKQYFCLNIHQKEP